MKKGIKLQFIINNERIIERHVIANEFNKIYFVSVASKLNEKATPVTNNFGVSCHLEICKACLWRIAQDLKYTK